MPAGHGLVRILMAPHPTPLIVRRQGAGASVRRWEHPGEGERRGGPVDDESGESEIGSSVAPMSAPAPIERLGMTAEELLELPDDGMRHELVEGELRTMTPAGF